MSRTQRITVALASAYVGLLAFATLTPAQTASTVTGIVGVISAIVAELVGTDPDATYAVAESAANVVLFMPLGIFVAASRASAPAIALTAALSIGAATSLAIEFAQRGIPGRFSTMADVAANSGGALLGALTLVLAARLWAATGRASRARVPGSRQPPTAHRLSEATASGG